MGERTGVGSTEETGAGADQTGAVAPKVGARERSPADSIPRAQRGGDAAARAQRGGAAAARAQRGGAAAARAQRGGAAASGAQRGGGEEEPPLPEPRGEEPPLPEPRGEEPPLPEPRGEEPPLPEPRGEEAKSIPPPQPRPPPLETSPALLDAVPWPGLVGPLGGMPGPPFSCPSSQVTGLPGTVACLVPHAAPPNGTDVTMWESDVACAPPSPTLFPLRPQSSLRRSIGAHLCLPFLAPGRWSAHMCQEAALQYRLIASECLCSFVKFSRIVLDTDRMSTTYSF
ncbi:UNVERIFIED_CONTAM: hypothetical protein FKN15_041531 [Acipenser sinensis]